MIHPRPDRRMGGRNGIPCLVVCTPCDMKGAIAADGGIWVLSTCDTVCILVC